MPHKNYRLQKLIDWTQRIPNKVKRRLKVMVNIHERTTERKLNFSGHVCRKKQETDKDGVLGHHIEEIARRYTTMQQRYSIDIYSTTEPQEQRKR